jgi:hypothetical protein
MAATYTPIASITLGAAASSVTFSSIPGTYTDLVIAGNGIAAADSGMNLQFNSDTGNNYSTLYIYGDGSSVVSAREVSQSACTGGRLGVNGSAFIFNIMNYSNTSIFKTVFSRGNNAAVLTIATAGLWRNTNAVTTINIARGGGGDISSGSTFNLYGILGANA